MNPSKMATTYLLAVIGALISGDMSVLPSDVSLYIALVVIVCNFIASHTKPPGPSSWLIYPYRIINWLAGNFGWAENRIKTIQGIAPHSSQKR